MFLKASSLDRWNDSADIQQRGGSVKLSREKLTIPLARAPVFVSGYNVGLIPSV